MKRTLITDPSTVPGTSRYEGPTRSKRRRASHEHNPGQGGPDEAAFAAIDEWPHVPGLEATRDRLANLAVQMTNGYAHSQLTGTSLAALGVEDMGADELFKAFGDYCQRQGACYQEFLGDSIEAQISSLDCLDDSVPQVVLWRRVQGLKPYRELQASDQTTRRLFLAALTTFLKGKNHILLITGTPPFVESARDAFRNSCYKSADDYHLLVKNRANLPAIKAFWDSLGLPETPLSEIITCHQRDVVLPPTGERWEQVIREHLEHLIDSVKRRSKVPCGIVVCRSLVKFIWDNRQSPLPESASLASDIQQTLPFPILQMFESLEILSANTSRTLVLKACNRELKLFDGDTCLYSRNLPRPTFGTQGSQRTDSPLAKIHRMTLIALGTFLFKSKPLIYESASVLEPSEIKSFWPGSDDDFCYQYYLLLLLIAMKQSQLNYFRGFILPKELSLRLDQHILDQLKRIQEMIGGLMTGASESSFSSYLPEDLRSQRFFAELPPGSFASDEALGHQNAATLLKPLYEDAEVLLEGLEPILKALLANSAPLDHRAFTSLLEQHASKPPQFPARPGKGTGAGSSRYLTAPEVRQHFVDLACILRNPPGTIQRRVHRLSDSPPPQLPGGWLYLWYLYYYSLHKLTV